MNSGFNFSVCRVCLKPDFDTNFSRLYGYGREELSEMFKTISRCHIKHDGRYFYIMTCNKCFEHLQEDLVLKRDIRIADEFFFGSRCETNPEMYTIPLPANDSKIIQPEGVYMVDDINEDFEMKQMDYDGDWFLNRGKDDNGLSKLSTKNDVDDNNINGDSNNTTNSEQCQCDDFSMGFYNQSDIAQHFQLNLFDYTLMEVKASTKENFAFINVGSDSNL